MKVSPDMCADMQAHIHLVPHHLRDGVMQYCLVGRPIGHFLTAVMENDLREAVARGDEMSLAGLRGIVQFMYNYGPGQAWGSRAKVDAWMGRS